MKLPVYSNSIRMGGDFWMTENDPFCCTTSFFRSAAHSLGPSAGDRVRWQQHRHEAIGQPQTQTADINYCIRCKRAHGCIAVNVSACLDNVALKKLLRFRCVDGLNQ